MVLLFLDCVLVKKMSSLGTSKGILEIAKFGIYVGVPIFLMSTFANNSKNMQRFMGNVTTLSLSPRSIVVKYTKMDLVSLVGISE